MCEFLVLRLHVFSTSFHDCLLVLACCVIHKHCETEYHHSLYIWRTRWSLAFYRAIVWNSARRHLPLNRGNAFCTIIGSLSCFSRLDTMQFVRICQGPLRRCQPHTRKFSTVIIAPSIKNSAPPVILLSVRPKEKSEGSYYSRKMREGRAAIVIATLSITTIFLQHIQPDVFLQAAASNYGKKRKFYF